MDSGRFVSIFSKFLGQKASQRSPKKMNLIVHEQKEDSEKMINPEHVSKVTVKYHRSPNMSSLVIRLQELQQLEI